MKKVYLMRKNVSSEKLYPLIEFIDQYKGGLFKAISSDDFNSERTIKDQMKNCKVALLFIGANSTSSQYIEEEIQLAHNLGLRRFVFSFDEEQFPAGSPRGIPQMWKQACSTISLATPSNVLRGIQGALKWGV